MYLFTSELIFQELRASLVVGGYLQPVVGIALLDTVVASNPPLVIMDVLGDSCELSHLARLLASKALSLLRNVA